MSMSDFVEGATKKVNEAIADSSKSGKYVIGATRHYVHCLMAMLSLSKEKLDAEEYKRLIQSLRKYDFKLWQSVRGPNFTSLTKRKKKNAKPNQAVVDSFKNIKVYPD